MSPKNSPRVRSGALVAIVLVALMASLTAAPASAANLRVRGNRLLDGAGSGYQVRLLGVNRSGLEYACIQNGGWGYFDSPHPDQIDSAAMIAAMNSWKINAVRVPLNEDCWLGLNAPPGHSGARYRRTVKRYVQALNAAGLYAVLDLHVAAPGYRAARDIVPMPDADHAPAFWRSVARTFKANHALVFDLYNEPHDIDWHCWLHGCAVQPSVGSSGRQPSYRAAGMQSLVDAVRSTGARQPLLLGGINWSSDLSGWNSHTPHDPAKQLIAAEHNYGGLSPCGSICQGSIVDTARRHPVLFGELGETDCAHSYIDQLMSFADRHGIGYLGWTWDAIAPGGWSCSGGPALITNYNGTPTAFGIGFRDHFRALARNGR